MHGIGPPSSSGSSRAGAAARFHRRLPGFVLLALLCALARPSAAQIAEADRVFEARSERLDGRLALPSLTEEAIRLYQEALAREPDSLEARWKLLRALHFLVDFTLADEDRKNAAMEEASALAKRSAGLLERAEVNDAERARLYFWSAIAWGVRAKRVGLLTVVREGLATQMRDYAERAAELDPGVDRGGPLRLLSRLHATLPRVPFVSGWVDRSQALPIAERAFELDPQHPGNRTVLAAALLERAPERRTEAIALLASVARAEPQPDFVAEFLAIREQALERLAALEEEAG